MYLYVRPAATLAWAVWGFLWLAVLSCAKAGGWGWGHGMTCLVKL